MLYRFVSNRELSQVVTYHFWLNFNLIKRFAIVNTNNRTNHFWYYNHVT